MSSKPPNAPPPPYYPSPAVYGYPNQTPGAGGGYQQMPHPPSNQAPYPQQHQHSYGYTNASGYPPIYPAGAGGSGYGTASSTTVIVQPANETTFYGGCPACKVGILEPEYTCPGIFLAIFFFPIGILCCLAMRQRRCPNCGAVFSS